MKCEACNDKKNQIKAGKTKAKPRSTNAKFAKNTTFRKEKRGYSEDIKKQAIKLYLEGNSSRAVGQILGIEKNMCLYWIRKYAKEIEVKETPNARVNGIEMDELYGFVERKKQILRDNVGQ